MADFYSNWILCKETLQRLKTLEVVDEELPLFKRLVNRQTTVHADLLLEAMERPELEPSVNNPTVVASAYLDPPPRSFPMLSEEEKDTAERVLRDLHRKSNGEDANNSKEAVEKAPRLNQSIQTPKGIF